MLGAEGNLRCGSEPVKYAPMRFGAICVLFVNASVDATFAPCSAWPRGRIGRVHLRTPSTAKGAQSFVWAVVFFLFLFFGMKAIGVDGATSLVLSLVAAFVIFVLVRTRGDVQD